MMNIPQITNIECINSNIYLSYYNEFRKKKFLKTYYCPYFYISEEKEIEDRFYVERNESTLTMIKEVVHGEFYSLKNKKLKKIICVSNSARRLVSSQFEETYEADVSSEYKFIIDRELKFDYNQRIMYFDIETNLSIDTERAEREITCMSAYDNFTQETITFLYHPEEVERFNNNIYYFSNEKKMLLSFISYLNSSKFDIICGWNIIYFDISYLIRRMSVLNIDYNQLSIFNRVTFIFNSKYDVKIKIFGLSIIDLRDLMKKITYENKPDDYKLNTVAKHFLNLTKVKSSDVRTMWNTDRPSLIKYNINDVVLLYKIDEKVKLIERYFDIQDIIPIPLHDIAAESKVIDQLLMIHFHNKIIFPSKKLIKNKVSFEGALTLEPIVGRHEWIAVYDFSKMYPSIYITFNISPDTLVEKDGDMQVNNLHISMSKEGIVQETISYFLDLRKKMSKEKSKLPADSMEWNILKNKEGGIKMLANSMYGVMGYPGFRLYDVRIASTITFIGRQLIMYVKQIAEESKYTVLYGDTDSIFVHLHSTNEDDCEKEAMKLGELINEKLKTFPERYGKVRKNTLEIECEKIFRSLLFPHRSDIEKITKKRYVGILFHKKGQRVNEVYARGIELRRKDCPLIFKSMLSEIVVKYLNNDFTIDLIKSYKNIISQQSIQSLGITKNIREELYTYKSNPQHIRAAKYSNKILSTNFNKSDNPKMLFIKNLKDIKEDCLMIDEDVTSLPNFIKVDYDRFFDFFITNKLVNLGILQEWESENFNNNQSQLSRFLS